MIFVGRCPTPLSFDDYVQYRLIFSKRQAAGTLSELFQDYINIFIYDKMNATESTCSHD